MKQFTGILFFVFLLTSGNMDALAIEEAKYALVKKDDKFEIRDYAAHVQAVMIVDGDFEDAGSKAFKTLLHYISGGNQTGTEIAMIAPVGQEPVQENWVVSFVMPAAYTLVSLPTPKEPLVSLREVPARRVAVISYSGVWSKNNYLKNKSELESWINKQNLFVVGEPKWARYDPPFTPWFLRRNEILIPIKDAM